MAGPEERRIKNADSVQTAGEQGAFFIRLLPQDAITFPTAQCWWFSVCLTGIGWRRRARLDQWHRINWDRVCRITKARVGGWRKPYLFLLLAGHAGDKTPRPHRESCMTLELGKREQQHEKRERWQTDTLRTLQALSIYARSQVSGAIAAAPNQLLMGCCGCVCHRNWSRCDGDRRIRAQIAPAALFSGLFA